MNICIIPARGGSKRIPRKNIKIFNGKPIIAYSIEVALKSGCFDKVIVSTDDDKISDIVKNFDGEIPFKRPAHLATDESRTFEA
jgi:N-acylneuraminate cytidylyltransferase